MWTRLAHFVLKFRLYLILGIGLITAFMGWKARDIEWSFDIAKIVPPSDPEMVTFEAFKQLFGEDGNIMAVGVEDSAIYEVENFARLKAMSHELEGSFGINSVLSLTEMQRLSKDAESRKFNFEKIFPEAPETQEELDSLLAEANKLRFYSGQLINPETGATIILISINKEVLNSKRREEVTNHILEAGNKFTEETGIDLYYAGLPYVRSTVSGKVSAELQLFLVLSLIITGVILLLFFRSWDAVVIPLIIIGVIVVWCLGTLALFGYKITLLTGLLPPIIVVIGIPNSVYLLNKYHHEFAQHGNKMLALSRMIRKIGLVALITNFTTAVGFLVLSFTDILILKEFGVVASINILCTFFVSIILIPAVFSYLPPPSTRQLRHLQFRMLDWVLTNLDLMVHRHPYYIFTATILIVGISLYGTSKLYSVSYMVDDIPEDSDIRRDLTFFENKFAGVMPLEIVVDTGKKRGIIQQKNLRLVEELEDKLAKNPYLSKPVSMVSFVKAITQAYYPSNNPANYRLPNSQERNFILRYVRNESDSAGLVSSFVDSTLQRMRISIKVADIGSNRMDSLVSHFIQPTIDSVFADQEDIQVQITGTTLLFIKGNKFLIENLQMSLVIAFVIIAIIMAVLFRNWKMILISLVPNMVPLIMTAGLMGFFQIPLKPSTALIFSIAFGISVDDSIHFLAKYRMELFANRFFVPVAISKSIRETGSSMMYTSIILFAGFVIFAGSEFGGTVALGVLTSTTLLIAMFTNLILLPALLIAFDSGKRAVDSHPPIEHYDEFYAEDHDEEIDLDRIEVGKPEDKGQQES